MTEKKNIFDNLAFWIIAVTVFLLPVFFLPASILGLGVAKLAIVSSGVLLALVCFIIERMRQGSINIPGRIWYSLLILIPVSYFVSSIFGVSWYKSLIGGFYEQDTFHTIAISFILLFLTYSLVTTPKRVSIVLGSLGSSIILVALFQIVRIIAGASLSLGVLSSPVLSLAGSWNDITSLMVLCLGAAVIVLETIEPKKVTKVLLSLIIVLAFFFVALSGSNFIFSLSIIYFSLPVLIGLIALVIFAYVFSLRHSKSSADREGIKANPFYASLLVLVLSVVLVVFGGPINDFLASKTGVNYLVGQPNWGPTNNVALEVIKQKPFFGSGPNSFSYEWNLHKPVAFNELPFWNTNFSFGVGIIPTSLTTVGIVGMILWILFYAFVISIAFKSLFRNDKTGSPLKVIVAFGVLFTTFLMIFSAPGIVVEEVHFLLIGIMLAFDASSLKKQKQILFNKKQWHHFVAVLVSIIAIIAITFWVYEIGQKIAATYYANQAVSNSKTEDEALAYMLRTVSLDPTQATYAEIMSQIYLSKISKLASLPASDIQSKQSEIKDNISMVVKYSLAAESIDPTDYSAPVATARAYEFLGSLGIPGAYDQAMAKYNYASALAPTNPLPLILASNLALSTNDLKSSETYLIKALQLKQGYADSPNLLKGITDIITALQKNNSKTQVVTPVATSTATSTKSKK